MKKIVSIIALLICMCIAPLVLSAQGKFASKKQAQDSAQKWVAQVYGLSDFAIKFSEGTDCYYGFVYNTHINIVMFCGNILMFRDENVPQKTSEQIASLDGIYYIPRDSVGKVNFSEKKQMEKFGDGVYVTRLNNERGDYTVAKPPSLLVNMMLVDNHYYLPTILISDCPKK